MWNFKLKEPKKGKKMNTQLLGGPSQFQQPPIEPVEQTCAMFVLWFLRPMAPLFQQPVPKAGCMQEIIFGRAMNRLLQKKRHVNSLISSFSFGSFGPWLPMLTACSKSRVHAGNQPWAGHKQVFAKKMSTAKNKLCEVWSTKKACQLIDFKLLFWFLRPLAPHVDRLFQKQGACRKPALDGP